MLAEYVAFCLKWRGGGIGLWQLMDFMLLLSFSFEIGGILGAILDFCGKRSGGGGGL